MKKKTLLKKLGIIAISAMVMTGTLTAPTIRVRSAESGDTGSAPEVEPESGGDEGGSSGGDEGGSSGGDEGGSSGGDEGGSSGGDEGGSSGGDEGGSSGGDEGGSSGGDEGGSSGGDEGGSSGGGGSSTGDDGGSDDEDYIDAKYDDGKGGTGPSGSEGSGTGAGNEDDDDYIDAKYDDGHGGTGGTSSTAAAGRTESAEAAATGTTAVLGEPEGYKEADKYNGTNEELIAQQHIVTDLPEIRKDFRFTTVDKVYAFSAGELDILEKRSDDAEVVGTIVEDGVLFELEEEEGGWIYVESGNVRGFVHGEDLIRGEEAEAHLEALKDQASRISAILPAGVSREVYFFTAQESVPYYENDAYAYRRITTQDTVIEKKAVLAKEDTSVREECAEDARETGLLYEGNLAYVIEDAGDGWLFVESGDVRGFARAEDLDSSAAAQKTIEETGEDSLSTALELIRPEDNKSTYYSINSIKEGAKYNEVREKILEKALSCVGNPYVWGGTSLTNGADCSGFVQTLYSLFGYHLPRVADAQSRVGTQIPVSDAAPGDLIFFARNGYVYHVAMYAGDGKTVEAYSTAYGIITKELSERNAVWATRIIED